MSREPNHDFRFSLTFPSRTHGEGTVHIEVYDERSGYTLIDLELNPTEWLSVLRGHQLNVRGWLLPEDVRGRLGLQVYSYREQVPVEVMPRFSSETTLEGEVWAKRFAADEGWDEYELRRSNDGWDLIGWVYAEPGVPPVQPGAEQAEEVTP